MQQTAAVLLNQSARVSFCIGILLALSSCHQRTRTEKVDRDAAVEVMVPEHGAYTGAFIDFGEAEEDVTLEGIEDFETMVASTRRSSPHRASGANRIFQPEVSRSSGSIAPCPWFSGRPGTGPIRRAPDQTVSI
jgi:hypothetical protein